MLINKLFSPIDELADVYSYEVYREANVLNSEHIDENITLPDTDELPWRRDDAGILHALDHALVG